MTVSEMALFQRV